MKRIGLCAAAALCALSVGLFGCSNSGSGAAATTAVTQETLAGTDWALDTSNPMAFDAYMFFEEEESAAALIIGGAEYDGTWAIEDSKGTVKLEDDNGTEQTIPLAMQGDKLVFGSNEGSKLVFVRDTSAGEGGAEGDAALNGDAEVEETEVVDEVIEDLKEPIEVVNDDSFKVTVTGKGTDFTGDPGYQLTIENKTKSLAMVMPEEDFTIDGKTFEAGSGDEIEAGETAKAFIYFDQTELKDGVEGLKNVKGTISIIDEDTDKELGKYEIEIA